MGAGAVIGCGGGGGNRGSETNGNPTTGTPGSDLTVNLNEDFGTVQFTYLTGQGRAPGDLYAVVTRQEVTDQFGTVRTQLSAPLSLPLDGYVLGTRDLNIPFTGESVRLFERYRLEFSRFLEEGLDDGGQPTFSERTPPPAETFNARIRVLPGRFTSLPILLDGGMFSTVGTTVEFNEDQFRLRNNIPNETDPLRTYFSDYVSFDLTAMPASERPLLSNGVAADQLFISGDNYALGANGRFEVLTLEVEEPIVGSFGPEGTLGGRRTPGTYTLQQPDPTDLSGIARITAAAGQWRSTDRAFSGFGPFEFILFPTSRDEAPDGTNGNGLQPDEDQEIAIVQRNASGQITAFYFGFADLDTGEFTVYPLRNIVDADVQGELTGTLSEYRNASGGNTVSYDLVRRGTFNFSTAPGNGFPSSGTFVVFRK
ncbi:MAG: hypothetical protein ACO1SV_20640 [Fimbriimonas sp.]